MVWLEDQSLQHFQNWGGVIKTLLLWVFPNTYNSSCLRMGYFYILVAPNSPQIQLLQIPDYEKGQGPRGRKTEAKGGKNGRKHEGQKKDLMGGVGVVPPLDLERVELDASAKKECVTLISVRNRSMTVTLSSFMQMLLQSCFVSALFLFCFCFVSVVFFSFHRVCSASALCSENRTNTQYSEVLQMML